MVTLALSILGALALMGLGYFIGYTDAVDDHNWDE